VGEEKRRTVDEPLEPLIHLARGQRVIIDSDLARLYGVTTKALNQAVDRNADRFPVDFAFRLTIEESANLKSQFVTSSPKASAIQGPASNQSQIVTGSHGGRRKLGRVLANAAILKRLAEIDQTLLRHDSALRDLYRKLQPLLAPPPDSPKRRIGF
jgi:hypothetical protein